MGWIQVCTVLCLMGAVRAQSGRIPGRPLLNPLGRPILADDVIGDEIPGVAGVDYPVLASVPVTDFRCDQLPYPGYYADQQAYCQAFYICERGGRGTGFLCPNGTLFNQEFLVCDWWNHVDCARAVDFYSVNEAVVRAMEEVDAAKLGRSPLDGSVFFNSRGEPLSAARIPGGRSSNYSPLGLERPFASPAVRSGLVNRYPTNNNLGRVPVPNAALLNTTPRPVLGFPNAFNNYRPLNGVGPLNNRYAYQPQNTLGALNNRYPNLPQNTLGALNNRYPNLPQNTLSALNNKYPYSPQNTLGALNNKYAYQPQNTLGALNNRYPNLQQNTLGALNNKYPYSPQNTLGALTNENPYSPQNTVGALNNRYPNLPQNTLGALNNRYPYQPQNTLGGLNNKNPYQPQNTLASLNKKYPYSPQNTQGDFNNRYPSRQGGALDNGYAYGRPGVGNAFNDGLNGLDGRNNNVNGINEGSKDDGRKGNDSGEYNRGNENGIGPNDGQDNGKYSKDNSKGDNDAGRKSSDKQTQSINGNNYRSNDNGREYDNGDGNGGGNRGDEDRERYRDDKKESDKGYYYDRPKNEFKGDGQVFGIVDPSKSYLPPLK